MSLANINPAHQHLLNTAPLQRPQSEQDAQQNAQTRAQAVPDPQVMDQVSVAAAGPRPVEKSEKDQRARQRLQREGQSPQAADQDAETPPPPGDSIYTAELRRQALNRQPPPLWARLKRLDTVV